MAHLETSASAARTAPGLGRPIALAVLTAAVAAAAVHLVFDAFGADFVVAPSGQAPTTVSAVMAAGIAAVVTTIGGLLALVLSRFTRRPSRWFLAAAAGVFAVMFVSPIAAADQLLTVVALELEHVAVAAAALSFLLPPLRARDRA